MNLLNILKEQELDFLERENERPRVAYLCLRVPPELIEASGAIPIRIAPREGFDKSINGLIRSDGCSFCRSVPAILQTPYYQNVKAVIGGACCDQMRRLLDTLRSSMDVPVILYAAPRTWQPNRSYFLDEFKQSFEYLFKHLGLKLELEHLGETIKKSNRLKSRVADLRRKGKLPNAVLQHLAMLPLSVEGKLSFLKQIGDEADQGSIRLGLLGSIPGIWELTEIERSGGTVVADMTCLGDRVFQPLADETIDPWEALYDAYVEKNLCPHRRPVDPLIDYVKKMVAERGLHGVVYRSVKYCHPWGLLADRMKKDLDLPMLVVDDDLTSPAVSNFRTRVGAFIEMLQSRGRRRA